MSHVLRLLLLSIIAFEFPKELRSKTIRSQSNGDPLSNIENARKSNVNFNESSREIYANETKNLYDFVEANKNLKVSCSILSNLWKQNSQSSVNKLIEVLKIIKTEEDNRTHEMEPNALDICDIKLCEEIVKQSAKKLSLALIIGHYDITLQIREFVKNLRNAYEDIFEETLLKAVDGAMEAGMRNDRLLHIFHYSNRISEFIAVLLHISWKMIENHQLDNSITFLIANYVGLLRRRPDYAFLSENKKNDLQNLSNQLSESGLNLCSGKTVCLRNVHYGKYIYVEDGPFNFINIHEVKTKLKENIVSGEKWLVRPIDAPVSSFPQGMFAFQNKEHRKEHMVAGGLLWKYVYSRTLSYGQPDASLWRIILQSHDAVVVNLKFNQYLCIANSWWSSENILLSNKFNPDNCRWHVDMC